MRRDRLEEEDVAVEEVEEVVTVTVFGTRSAELTARTTGREAEDEEVTEEEIVDKEEDGEIEETVAATCPPTTGGRMTALMIATTVAAEIAAMEDAEVDVEAMMVDAVIVEVEEAEADTRRTGPSLRPETREWRRNSSTLHMVHQGSTLKGQH